MLSQLSSLWTVKASMLPKISIQSESAEHLRKYSTIGRSADTVKSGVRTPPWRISSHRKPEREYKVTISKMFKNAKKQIESSKWDTQKVHEKLKNIHRKVLEVKNIIIGIKSSNFKSIKSVDK